MACSVSTDSIGTNTLDLATLRGSWCISGGGSSTVEFAWGYGNFDNTTPSDTIENTSFPSEDCGQVTKQVSVQRDRTIQAKVTSGACGQGGTLVAKTKAADAVLGTPSVGTPTQTTLPVSGSITPNTDESSGTATLQFKAQSSGTWLDGPVIGTSLSGTSAIAVGGTVTGLIPGTIYDFRFKLVRSVSAQSSVEQLSSVASGTTRVAQSATTVAADTITGISARIKGTVNPNDNNNAVSYRWEYGTTTNYGTTTPTQGPISGTSTLPVLANISGLTGNTLYHFRIKAFTSEWTVFGGDLTFTTISADPVVSFV